MKVLLVCMEHAYGDATRPKSYEYFSFYLSLQGIGHDVELFDFMVQTRLNGKQAMNDLLLARVLEWHPDLVMFSLYQDDFESSTIDTLRKHTKTLCFFHDDTWRVDFTRYWAPHFDFFTTPDVYGEAKYRSIGLTNAIYFPFGCNETIFRPLDVPVSHDVSFVGAWHPARQWLIEQVGRRGYRVEAFGYRWPKGELDLEQMVALFNSSKINLNLSNSASWDARYLLSSPRGLINRFRSPKTVEQIKGRYFEISGSGAFQLAAYVEGLERLFAIGAEIGIFVDLDDLLRKIDHYLLAEEERAAISDAALRRTLNDHTFRHRFEETFARMGLT